jgi:hypothetical protein
VPVESPLKHTKCHYAEKLQHAGAELLTTHPPRKKLEDEYSGSMEGEEIEDTKEEDEDDDEEILRGNKQTTDGENLVGNYEAACEEGTNWKDEWGTTNDHGVP